MTDYRVKISVRNARFMRALESLGHTPCSFAGEYGFTPSEICALAAMKIKPTLKSGMWRKSVMKLCDLARVMPDSLFSARQMEGLRTSVAVREVDEEAIEAMMFAAPDPEALAITNNLAGIADAVLDSIDLRSSKAFRMHVDGATLEEIGNELGVNRERARQIVERTRRKVLAAMKRKGVSSF